MKRIWVAWVLSVAVTAAVQWQTLTLSSATWQDEVQIVEIGRQVLDPDSPWSVVLNNALVPVPAFSYLGATLHELIYRATGTPEGIRVATQLSAIAGSGVLLAWLLQRGIVGWIAWAVALLYLLDPGFDRSYRGGRLEALVFLCTFASCLAIGASVSHRRRTGLLIAAGALTGLLPWLWTTAVVLLPLIGFELWRVTAGNDGSAVADRWRQVRMFAVGLLCGAVLPVVPVTGYVWSAAVATISHAFWDAGATNPAAAQGDLWSSIVSTVRYSPFLPLLAVLGLHLRSTRRLVVIACGLLLLMAATRFYLYRYLYVLPYLLPIVGAGLTWAWHWKPEQPWVRRAIVALVVVAIGWGAALSLGARTVVAWQERPWRDPVGLVALFEREVGAGPHTVYAGTLDVYFAGRQLGWQMFSNKFAMDDAQMDRLLEDCDVVVMLPHEATSLFKARITKLGFDEGRVVHTGPFEQPMAYQWPRYGGVAYGPYEVFFRRRLDQPTR